MITSPSATSPRIPAQIPHIATHAGSSSRMNAPPRIAVMTLPIFPSHAAATTSGRLPSGARGNSRR